MQPQKNTSQPVTKPEDEKKFDSEAFCNYVLDIIKKRFQEIDDKTCDAIHEMAKNFLVDCKSDQIPIATETLIHEINTCFLGFIPNEDKVTMFRNIIHRCDNIAGRLNEPLTIGVTRLVKKSFKEIDAKYLTPLQTKVCEFLATKHHHPDRFALIAILKRFEVAFKTISPPVEIAAKTEAILYHCDQLILYLSLRRSTLKFMTDEINNLVTMAKSCVEIPKKDLEALDAFIKTLYEFYKEKGPVDYDYANLLVNVAEYLADLTKEDFELTDELSKITPLLHDMADSCRKILLQQLNIKSGSVLSLPVSISTTKTTNKNSPQEQKIKSARTTSTLFSPSTPLKTKKPDTAQTRLFSALSSF